nr:GTP cyclohydrolase I FolE [Isosphaera pallida]
MPPNPLPTTPPPSSPPSQRLATPIPIDLMEEDGPPTAASTPSPVDLERIARAVREILIAVGENPDREGIRDTPQRVARMYAEVFQGLHQNPRDHLKTAFTETYEDTILIRDIAFISFCEHHLLPFVGKTHVAYRPRGRVVGLSKVPRVVDVLSRRPQLQERLTTDLADLLHCELDAQGVAVMVEATHSCMTIRGVSKPGSSCWTFAMRGVYETDPALRAEVLAMVRGG